MGSMKFIDFTFVVAICIGPSLASFSSPAFSAEGSRATVASPTAFIAPPRTISDITAILDAEKPDGKKLEQLRAEADVKPPVGGPKHDLAWFYYNRGSARAELGRLNEAIEDGNMAIDVGQGVVEQTAMLRFLRFAGIHYNFAGNPKRALAIFLRLVQDANDANNNKGQLLIGRRHITNLFGQIGDIAQAELYLRRNLALIQEARTKPGWRTNYAIFGHTLETNVAMQRALVFEARGQFKEAEGAYREAELQFGADLRRLFAENNVPIQRQTKEAIDFVVLFQARVKAR